MSAQGGNLQQPSKKVLFNSITADDLGYYYDTELGVNVLQFKKHGFTIPAMATTEIQVGHTVDFIPKVSLYQLTGNMPCLECNYEYGLILKKRVKKPGVDNPDYYPHKKMYGGTIVKPVPQTAGGSVLSNAQILEMKETIIQGINLDLGWKSAYPYEHPGSIAKAGKAIIATAWNAASAITINGNAYGAQATIGAFIAAINAGDDAYAYIHPVTATSIVIIANETSGNGNTLAVVATAGTITIGTTIYIGLIAKYTDVDYSVEVEPFFGSEFLRVQNVRFSMLTADDIFQKFSHLPNRGVLAAETRINNPLNEDFAKIVLINKLSHYELFGASHACQFISEVEIYIPESVLNSATKKWSQANPMAAGANWDLDEMTEGWLGLVQPGKGWATLVGDIQI